jgi:radical SAM superfamily enzyme YgiQ (UPF0313 family)
MKIALIQCPAFGIDRPPIALGYLSAFLRSHGHTTAIFDFNIELYFKANEQNRKFWDFQYVFQWLDNNYFANEGLLPKSYFKDWAREVVNSSCDVISLSLQSSSLTASINLAREIKEIAPEKTIVFGGPLNLSYNIDHAYYLLGLENASKVKIIDILVLGEGEETFIDILSRLKRKITLEGCPGVVFARRGSFIDNGMRPLIKDIDSIPFPDFSDFPDKYKYKKRMPILSSRGCVHKCVFCDDTLMWNKFRCRSAGNIVDEIRLRKKQGVEFLEFNDLLINGNLQQLSAMCDLLIQEKIEMPWGASACVDKRMNPYFFEKLRRAGCRYLNYGIESASPKVLAELNKSFTIQEAKKVIKFTYQAGITVCTNWIVGFPTETISDFKQTLDFITDNFWYLKNSIMVNSFILKHNSIIFKDQKKYGIISDKERNWHSLGGANTVNERKRRYDGLIQLISTLGDNPAHETFQK